MGWRIRKWKGPWGRKAVLTGGTGHTLARGRLSFCPTPARTVSSRRASEVKEPELQRAREPLEELGLGMDTGEEDVRRGPRKSG